MERIESEHCKRVLLLLSHQWPLYIFSNIKTLYEAFENLYLPFANNCFALLGIDRILHFSKRNNFPLTAPVPFILFFSD
jgi:hypothetical protein